MPSKFNSPYASPFKTAVKSGTPCSTVVNNICKRTGKPVSTVVKSLVKAGICFSQKFNGTLVYWPAFPVRGTSNTINTSQTTLWQAFIDWCILNRWCTPSQLKRNATNQKAFMSFCKSFFGRQFVGTVQRTKSTSKSKRKPKAKRRSLYSRSRKSWSSPKTKWTARHTKKRRTSKRVRKTASWRRASASRSYRFPSYKSRTSFRRYARAA
ncbi:MAG: hypothetical protein L0Y44_05755 [Phycisphaerales bacterium]|nr:hypothetical protein [Phycisphaerales bacterium]MCI0630143.1 hypothetical protein [Phycisphaerales bacterium]MCI0675942.1 hypothetical protein [Phycisphaerales bacterium]